MVDDELNDYNSHWLALPAGHHVITLPLDDEPFAGVWSAYAAAGRGIYAVLQDRLPQLRFPIQEGISQSAEYRGATRRGVPPAHLGSATGLMLNHPEEIRLEIHPSLAGRIPVLIVADREDFVGLVRALAMRNEPGAVPDSLGALAVSGYNNWDRIAGLRRTWEAQPAAERRNASWEAELAAITPCRELYQDRFILLSEGFYSAVPAAELGLDPGAWRRLSLVLRRAHECFHYLTWRLFGAARNNMLDELIADYAGIVAATGSYRADWFLRFVGLEAYPELQPGGRLQVYRGTPPLSDEAFRALWKLVREAALNLQRFDERLGTGTRAMATRRLLVIALALMRLDEIAGAVSAQPFERAVAEVGARVRFSPVDELGL